MPEPLPIHNKFLPDVYRYAFLMTGSVATAIEVLRSAVEGASRGLSDEDRKPGYAKRWLFAKARELCRHPQLLRAVAPPAVAGHPEAEGAAAGETGEAGLRTVPAANDAANAPNRLAAFFALLPEKERSALVLFYLCRFNLAEMAEILEIKVTELGPLLKTARMSLQQHKVEYAGLLAQPPAGLPADAPAQ